MAGGGASFAFLPFFFPSPLTFGVLGGLGGLGGFGGLGGLASFGGLGVFIVLGVFFLGTFSTGGGGSGGDGGGGGGGGVRGAGDGIASFSTGLISSTFTLALTSGLLTFNAFCRRKDHKTCVRSRFSKTDTELENMELFARFLKKSNSMLHRSLLV